MSDLLALVIVIGLLGVIVLIIWIGCKIIDWRYDWKERKFAEKYPELTALRKEYDRKLSQHCAEWNKIIPQLKEDIERFEKEKMYLPIDILEKRTQEIEETKKKLYNEENRLNAEYAELQKKYIEIMKDPEE